MAISPSNGLILYTDALLSSSFLLKYIGDSSLFNLMLLIESKEVGSSLDVVRLKIKYVTFKLIASSIQYHYSVTYLELGVTVIRCDFIGRMLALDGRAGTASATWTSEEKIEDSLLCLSSFFLFVVALN
jgi:hypothetical protein